MLEFQKPSIEITDVSDDKTYGKFVVEPLERGYATTLGNSLRRVMLSSLPGSAITSVKIDGVLHEFSTLEGVSEDVVEIILNLKKVIFKNYSDETKTVTIDVTGEKEVTAADIICDSDIEVLNPDAHIASLMSGTRLSMSMVVENGRGYNSVEKNKKEDMPIGTIPIDSIFTPAKRVKFAVENTRVGNVTDLDKLTLEVWTNGTISPEEAVSLASKILNDHFQMFIDLNENLKSVSLMVEREESVKEKVLEMSIEELELSVRSNNCLRRAEIHTVEQLVNKTEEEMSKVRNLGKKSLNEIKKRLADMGLSLKHGDE
ncbi:MAG: DNA-directed RNA polymerase subunit alpha [Eubacteriaceae bacterium]|nr:DNA-directed RNA polymerase subunit alpha [Eubacteriaceae bacterium]MBR2780633.1 DNA-directed RNA polymerase subunit alpha [Eubacteriaceae bacterium]